MSLARAYLQELRAFPRARHVWHGAIVIAALNALMAVVLATSAGIRGFSLFALAFIPSGMAPLAASSFASLRADRLADRLHTAGVPARTFLLARALALLTVGALYLLSTVPVFLVLGAKMGVGWPEDASRWLYVGAGLVSFGVAFGFVVAALLPGARGAPAALAGGVATLSLLAGILKGLLLDSLGPGIGMRILHLLPHVGLFEGAGFSFGSSMRPSDPARSQLAFAIYLIALALVGILIHARYQGAAGWRIGSRRGAYVALALVLLVPIAVASGDYEARRGAPGAEPTLDAVIVPRGAPFADFDDLHTFPLGRPSQADVLVELPRGWKPDARVSVSGTPDAGVRSAGTPRVDGDHLRVPISVAPRGAGGLDLQFQLVVVRIEGVGAPQMARALLGAEGEDARGALFLAGTPAVAFAATGAILRRRSVAQ